MKSRTLSFMLAVFCLMLPSAYATDQAPMMVDEHGQATVEESSAPAPEESPSLWDSLVHPAPPEPVEAPPAEVVNPIHPLFAPLDKNGLQVRHTGLPMATETTCKTCHDTGFIQAHSSHHNDTVKADCLQCHAYQGRLEVSPAMLDTTGNLRRDFMTLSAPKAENCALCHGYLHTDKAPLTLPEDFSSFTARGAPATQGYDLTQQTGEVFSQQKLNDSYLNLADKENLNQSWDVHAARMLECTSCHKTGNNPEQVQDQGKNLSFLKQDPRGLDTAQYLQKPDHRLTKTQCTTCHDPMAVHEELPYKERHMARLDCRACHVPKLFGPALKELDRSILTDAMTPRTRYRGVDEANPQNLNTTYLKGYHPFLIWEKQDSGESKLAPYNLVTETRWMDEATGEDVPDAALRAALFDGKGYVAPILAALDSDGDKKLSDTELRLDHEAKVEAVKQRLSTIGVKQPRLKQDIVAHKVHHGVMGGDVVSLSCANCHDQNSRLGEPIPLAGFALPGVTPTLKGTEKLSLSGSLETKAEGLYYERGSHVGDAYVLGHDRAPWVDLLGLLIFLATAIGIAGHGGLRIRARLSGKLESHHVPMKRVYMYSLYERIWHWLMAGSILLLALTGIEIHWVGAVSIFGFDSSVWLHNLLAVIMIANAFLSLFYHLVSTDIKQFIPPTATFFEEALAQAKYYLNGIFVGAPHPMAKTKERKLNPLQQVTYMGLLNVLIPFQVITGLLIWGVSQWPELAQSIGGLTWVTPLHSFGSWLLVTFVLAHVYLTTTGHTVFSNVQAMVSGYEDIEDPSQHGKDGSHDH